MNYSTLIRSGILAMIMPGITLMGNPVPVIADTAPLTEKCAAAVCVDKVTQPADNRGERLDAYFKKYDMPLEGYGKEFVAAADSCGLDWRLLPAIGVRESSGGKHLMNNNPFGWGSAKIPFKNFSEAIVDVTNHLCGLKPTTARYYKDTTITKKLWYYNGSVIPAYTGQVLAIMNRF